VTQQARNLNVRVCECSGAFKYLVRDRDTKFTVNFDEVFRPESTKVMKTPEGPHPRPAW
jgi:putative transposase